MQFERSPAIALSTLAIEKLRAQTQTGAWPVIWSRDISYTGVNSQQYDLASRVSIQKFETLSFFRILPIFVSLTKMLGYFLDW